MDFKIGDMVRKKSGSDNITVIKIEDKLITCKLPDSSEKTYESKDLINFDKVINQINSIKTPTKQ